MAQDAGLFLAIWTPEAVLKHWALYVDRPKDEQKLILQIKGSPGTFCYEERVVDPRDDENFEELILIISVVICTTRLIQMLASNLDIRNYNSH